MTNSRKYTITEFRAAIAEVGASPAAIAAYLSCTRGTVYRYLRKFPELKAEFEAQRGEVVGERAQYPKEVFVQAIAGSFGIKSTIAERVGCHRNTVENALERWPELRDLLDAQRSGLVAAAVSALAVDVRSPESKGHQQAYMFVLKTLGKDEGFTERQEVTGADGAGLFDLPEDVRQQIAAAGLDAKLVLQHFIEMVRGMGA